MHSRLAAVGLGAVTLLGFAACGSDAGTGAAPQTTALRLAQTTYVTQAPILTSTSTAETVLGAVGTVAGEQKYTVVSGDALYNIAKKFCLTPLTTGAETIAAYNQWADGVSHLFNVGDIIRIPGGACAPGTSLTTTNTAPQPTSAPQTTPVAPEDTTTTLDASSYSEYVVQAGDYLTKIATKTGVTTGAIVQANGWANDQHVIIPGQKIKIPNKTG